MTALQKELQEALELQEMGWMWVGSVPPFPEHPQITSLKWAVAHEETK